MQEHEKWMTQALQLAQQAGDQDEVPVGAVLVEAGELIASGFNQVIGISLGAGVALLGFYFYVLNEPKRKSAFEKRFLKD